MAVTAKPANGAIGHDNLFIVHFFRIRQGTSWRSRTQCALHGGRPIRRYCGNGGVAPARFPRAGGNDGKPSCGFPRFRRRAISTGLLPHRRRVPPAISPQFSTTRFDVSNVLARSYRRITISSRFSAAVSCSSRIPKSLMINNGLC